MKRLEALRVLVITGAGISAESGIPTFRGAGGLWRNFDSAKLATESAFRAAPQLVWDWYRERREKIRASRPNAAHAAVVRLAVEAREFLLVTQNVDDLHARAEWNGHRLPSEKLVQIHGDIFITRCSGCAFSRRDSGMDSPGVPVCPTCGCQLRPGVVWFGESLPPRELARIATFLARGPCDLVLVVGTTALFGYIVQWAVDAKAPAGRLIEINPDVTPISASATETIRQPAAVAMPALVAKF